MLFFISFQHIQKLNQLNKIYIDYYNIDLIVVVQHNININGKSKKILKLNTSKFLYKYLIYFLIKN
mgnify:CR=1 FL=1